MRYKTVHPCRHRPLPRRSLFTLLIYLLQMSLLPTGIVSFVRKTNIRTRLCGQRKPFHTSVVSSHIRRGCSGPISSIHQSRTHAYRLSTVARGGASSSSADSNPTVEWKGASHSTSGLFVTHVLIPAEQAPCSVVDRVQQVLEERRRTDEQNTMVTELSAQALVDLGAVWFLPADAPRDPCMGHKPKRMTDPFLLLQQGDYLRIHHFPRRFPAVHEYDWSNGVDVDNQSSRIPGVVVAENSTMGWLVINKPAMVPVHMTVDNCQENVAACLRRARAKDSNLEKDTDGLPYVTTPQRLDQNTSGLLVVATQKVFASYYASLLRSKTEKKLNYNEDESSSQPQLDGIHKLYRCLVCLIEPQGESSWSVGQAAGELQDFAATGKLLRHYLEPSIRAPKRFVSKLPLDAEWPECVLRIRQVSDVHALVGNPPAQCLARALWSRPTEDVPPNCLAVMELEVELLTGRTHQCRGQLSSMGFPIVGDAQYGGSIPRVPGKIHGFEFQGLALQCCELEFLDPEVVVKKDGTESMRRSKQWNRFRLDDAWWSPFLCDYEEQMKNEKPEAATTLASDIGLVEHRTIPVTTKPARPDLLPPRVSLSPGKHKYVLIRATHPNADEVEWFVKSAAPGECGGPYHGNVAQDLREWIEAAGYQPKVTGGGRIDYRPDERQALVYGFSYGFGKGDHSKAASIIRDWSQGVINATYDNTDGLY